MCGVWGGPAPPSSTAPPELLAAPLLPPVLPPLLPPVAPLPEPPDTGLPDEDAARPPPPELLPPPPSAVSPAVGPAPVWPPWLPQAVAAYPTRIPTNDDHDLRWAVMDILHLSGARSTRAVSARCGERTPPRLAGKCSGVFVFAFQGHCAFDGYDRDA